MSDKELDEILAEIKQRSMTEHTEEKPEAIFGDREVKEKTPILEEKLQDIKVPTTENLFEEQMEEEVKEEPASVPSADITENLAEEVPQEPTEVPAPQDEEIITLDDSVEEEIPYEEFAPAEEEPEDEPAFSSPEEMFAFISEEPVNAEKTEDSAGLDDEEEAIDLGEIAKEETTKKSKKPLIIAIAVVLLIALAAGIYFGFIYHKEAEPETTTAPVSTTAAPVVVTQEDGGILNPLTGESGFNEAAIGKRPVAVVVENEYSTASVRPQWGISDADMIMEGETEYSTRMLFFWADYTNMPKQIGSTRSARPPFIRFSQLFDSIFIHAGLSHSKGNYVGADSVFESDNVDHINLLNLEETGTYFGRDKSRTSTIEHTGYLNGTNTAELIAKQKFRTDLNANRFTQFAFNKDAEKLSDTECKKINFKWSDRCPKTAKFTYSEENGYYTTTDFDSRYGEANLKLETLIFLLDETEYIVKENYKGSGNSETYCNYHLSGGKGMIVSEGTALEINWEVEDGKIVMKTTDGKDVKLNPGKIYIGYGSSNHGGSITLNPESSN